MENEFRSKETSWLSFNARVLQEAADPTVPLYERIKFLGIYSSNMDEFFRVRVATLRRLVQLGDRWKELGIPNPKETLKKVVRLVSRQGADFNDAYDLMLKDLDANGIQLINETQVPQELESWLRDYFRRKVLPHVFPIILKTTAKLPQLEDHPMYLAVRMSKKDGTGRSMHSLIEIPQSLPRFLPLPKSGETQLVMYLDDIIRFGLDDVFDQFSFDQFESYAIKFTRDAELELDDDFTESFYEKLADSLRARDRGLPVRANFDQNFPKPFLNMVLRKLNLASRDALYPGARYHNRRDLLSFPSFGKPELFNPPTEPVPLKGLRSRKSMFAAIKKRDLLLHIPYHSFGHLIELIQEASLDPLVHSIRMTQYRAAKNSCVARALMAAARNGKEVMVLVEPQARFDEEANIAWAERYRSAGVRVQLGVQGLKVHAKLVLIERKEQGKLRYYSCLGTGNFNEDTATIFADHLLMTHDQEFGKDVARVFRFFQQAYRPPKLKHLKAAPLDLRKFLHKRVEKEIENFREGKPAGISVKVNNLSDPETIDLLHRAAAEGVRVRLIVRSMFSMVTGESTIEAIGIVDKYLEHSRLLMFENGGNQKIYLSSADFLPRNFDSRIETIFPIYDKRLRKQLKNYFEIQWEDNSKARILDHDLSNQYRPWKVGDPVKRAQYDIENFLRNG